MTTLQMKPAGDGRYRVTWTEAGKRRQRTFADVHDARRFRTAHLSGLAQPTPDVSDLVRRWVTGRQLAPATSKRVESTRARLLEPFFGSRRVETIQARDVAEWVRWLRERHQHSPATIRSHFSILRAALDWAVTAGLLGSNPCSRVALPRVPAAYRMAALTRLPRPVRPQPTTAHHRAGGPLIELRRALSSTDDAAELTQLIRHLDLNSDGDGDY